MTAGRPFKLDRPRRADARAKEGILRGMDATGPWPPPDPLGEALHLLRMDGAFYSRAELSAPWGMTLTPMPDHLWFHVVTVGRVLLEIEGADPTWLQPGDFALVPHGNGHRLRSEPGVAAPDVLDLDLEHVSERYEIIRHGEGGAPTTLVCGAVRFDHPAARHLVGILPRLVFVAASDASRAAWMHNAFQLMAAEARAFKPGGEAVITRLADILVIQAIRSWIETDPAARSGWLGALQDRQIGRALALIHRDPARAWTVAALADESPMSRSAFAARFTELVDEPAMRYVTRWRMHLALHALRTEEVTVGELADRLGYRSEAAFARAFKRVIGAAPGGIRRGAAAPAG
jgi:AraC-like DNA-binding protein